MTIALLTDGIYPFTLGGIQKHSYYLAKYWARQGVGVHVYHPNHYEEATLEEHFAMEELQYIRFYYVAHPTSMRFPGHYIVNSYRYSIALYKAVNQSLYDGIYAQGFTGWYFLRQQPNHPKLTSNLHGLNMFQRYINLKDKVQLLALQIPARSIIMNSAKQISLGGQLTDILYRHGAKPGTVHEVPNAISPEWLVEFKPDRINHQFGNNPVRFENSIRRFIFIGRYERLKGIEEIHAVLQQLMAEGCLFEFHFIGPIPEEKRYAEQRCDGMMVNGMRYNGNTVDGKTVCGQRSAVDGQRYDGMTVDGQQSAVNGLDPHTANRATNTPHTANLTPTDPKPSYQQTDTPTHPKPSSRHPDVPQTPHRKPTNPTPQTDKPHTDTPHTAHRPTATPHSIIYHGAITSQETIRQLLYESDVLVCPSYSEGMPTVILEAMACQCAIIATDVGATGELVDPHNGWLIKGDIVQGLKKAMQEAVALDNETLQHMKEASYQKVKEKYTWDVVAQKSLEVIRC